MCRPEDDIVSSLLGVVVAPLHRAEADSLEMPGSGAVLIVRVDEGKVADRSGLKAGDIIVSVNDDGLRGFELRNSPYPPKFATITKTPVRVSFNNCSSHEYAVYAIQKTKGSCHTT